MKIRLQIFLAVVCFVLFFAGCSAIKKTYQAGKGTVKGTLWAVTGVYKFTKGTTKLVYKVGEFSFNVAKAPLSWELTNPEIEEIDGLPVKEAIRQGRVKNSPYTVKGTRYHPMTVANAQDYDQEGVASWLRQ